MTTRARHPNRLVRTVASGLVLALTAAQMVAAPPVAGGSAARPGDDSAFVDLAPLPPAAPTQVVVFDRASRTTTLVSHGPGAAEGIGSSSRPSISGDGGLVAFESAAALVASDVNRRRDVYVWERAADVAQPISLARDGSPANGDSRDPSLAADGSVIAFTSTATNLTGPVGLDGRTNHVFAWQRSTGDASLVSVAGARAGSGASSGPAVSSDGRVVAFESAAADLIEGDTNDVRDVFLRDLTRQATIRASVRGDGRQVGVESRRPSVAGNGGTVVFDSTAASLVPRDTNAARDVFLRDLPAVVQVGPDPVDFGVVPLGTPGSKSVSVVSVGWTPVTMAASTVSGPSAVDFVVSGDGCTGQTLAYGLSCTILVLHVPSTSGPKSASLSITDSAVDSPQVIELVGGVPAPSVRLDPALGPPGVVTVLTGTAFPPGSLVTVSWDVGISQKLDPVVVNADGTFSVGVLVYHHDRLGPRTLIVTPRPGGPTFPANSAAFLVVPGPNQPTGPNALTFLSTELELVNRR